MAQERSGKPRNPTDKNPAHQTGEERGPINKPQRTEATMRQKDLPRGSDEETRGKATQR